MLFRYRARNYPHTLNEEENKRWQEFRASRLLAPESQAHYREEMSEARDRADSMQEAVLDELDNYTSKLLAEIETG